MKKKVNYNFGGALASLAPLMNLAVPGLGTVVGTAASLATMPTNYKPLRQNENPYGFQDGGPLQPKPKKPAMALRKKAGYDRNTFANDEDYNRYMKRLEEIIQEQKVRNQASTDELMNLRKSSVWNKGILRDAREVVDSLLPYNFEDGGTYQSNGVYPSGQDQQLSDNSYEVNYPGNATDAKNYGPFQFDDKEVIDMLNQFVYSDEKDLGENNRSPAELVKPLMRAKGKAEKKLKINPYDEHAKNTVTISDMSALTIAQAQENKKQVKAYRGNIDPELQTQYQSGGPLPDYLKQPGNIRRFQIYANKLEPGILGKTGIDEIAGPKTLAAWEKYGENYEMSLLPNRRLTDNISTTRSNVFPSADPLPEMYTQVQYGLDQSLQPTPNTLKYGRNLNPGYTIDPSLEKDVLTSNQSPYDGIRKTPSSSNFAFGDVLQGIEALSTFRGLGQGPEIDPLYQMQTRQIDDAPIRRNIASGFNAAASNINTSSMAGRNAVLSNLYSNRLGQESDALTNIATQNKQLASQTEQYNLGQRRLTDDINARNRAAFDQAQSAAFQTVGNTGRALNKKQQGKQAMKYLEATYPDVFNFLMTKIR